MLVLSHELLKLCIRLAESVLNVLFVGGAIKHQLRIKVERGTAAEAVRFGSKQN